MATMSGIICNSNNQEEMNDYISKNKDDYYVFMSRVPKLKD